MSLRATLQRAIRPSTTRSTAALWAKSLLNAVLFFAIFMLALPWLAHQLLPLALPLPAAARTWLAGALALVGVTVWIACRSERPVPRCPHRDRGPSQPDFWRGGRDSKAQPSAVSARKCKGQDS